MRSHGAPSRAVKFYRVGGSVRDELLGRPVADRDWVVVGATPEILIASGYKPVGRDFPVFLHRDTGEEYALARTERKHGRGYRGFEFFASPDVTLVEDLARRDLTINAMARDERGELIDPYGGQADLEAGVLRHVSPAFVEDPLRVLRVARFAARFRFRRGAGDPAPDARAGRDGRDQGARAPSASGRNSPKACWSRIRRGCSRCCATAGRSRSCCRKWTRCTPRVRARGVRRPSPGARLSLALEHAAKRGFTLPVRYAVLAHDFNDSAAPARRGAPRARAMRDLRRAEAMSARLKVPLECRDAARLAARWHRVVVRAPALQPAVLLDLINAADALRRPERLETLLHACECVAHVGAGCPGRFRPGTLPSFGARGGERRRRRRDRPRGGARTPGIRTGGCDREGHTLGAARRPPRVETNRRIARASPRPRIVGAGSPALRRDKNAGAGLPGLHRGESRSGTRQTASHPPRRASAP